VAREFRAFAGREADLERVYGPDGLWAELLSKAAGFIATVLERRSKRQYQLFDYWISHQDFEAFRKRHHASCQQLAEWAKLDGIVDRELLLGSFYEFGGDDDEGLEVFS
jgi:hypothetical protein